MACAPGSQVRGRAFAEYSLVLLSQKATVTGISESFMEANRTEATGAGMGRHGVKDIESRFTGYVEELVSVIGHADRSGPFRDYCTGLVMPGERKSVEPMAAITAPGRPPHSISCCCIFAVKGGGGAELCGTK